LIMVELNSGRYVQCSLPEPSFRIKPTRSSIIYLHPGLLRLSCLDGFPGGYSNKGQNGKNREQLVESENIHCVGSAVAGAPATKTIVQRSVRHDVGSLSRCYLYLRASRANFLSLTTIAGWKRGLRGENPRSRRANNIKHASAFLSSHDYYYLTILSTRRDNP